MHWNYRVIKKKNPQNGESYYEVCEVYYDKDNNPKSWTENKHVLCFEEWDDLKTAYQEIQKAFEKPVLEFIDDEHDRLKEVTE